MDKSDRDRLFCEMFARHIGLVRSVVYKTGRYLSADDRDEIVQNVMVKAWEKFDPEQLVTFHAWIASFARFTTIDMIRHRKRNLPLNDDERLHATAEPIAVAEAELDDPATRAMLAHAIGRLPRSCRDVVTRHRDGMTHAQIAKKLRITTPTVRTRLSRGLKNLRKQLLRAQRP